MRSVWVGNRYSRTVSLRFLICWMLMLLLMMMVEGCKAGGIDLSTFGAGLGSDSSEDSKGGANAGTSVIRCKNLDPVQAQCKGKGTNRKNYKCPVKGYDCEPIEHGGKKRFYCCKGGGGSLDSDLLESAEDGKGACRNMKSNCEARASLCTEEECYDVMFRECKKTCNFCNKCKDLGSDCRKMRSYCNTTRHPLYEDLMSWQCPKTCKRGCGKKPKKKKKRRGRRHRSVDCKGRRWRAGSAWAPKSQILGSHV